MNDLAQIVVGKAHCATRILDDVRLSSKETGYLATGVQSPEGGNP
jgi:hypothetical protein